MPENPLQSVPLTFTALTVSSGNTSVMSSPMSNPGGAANNMQYGFVRLTFGTPITAGSGAPYISLGYFHMPDGTTPPNPPGTSAAAWSPNQPQCVVQLTAGATITSVDFGPVPIDPPAMGFAFNNQSGVNWTGTVTANFYGVGIG